MHLHSGLEMLKVTVLSLSLNVSYLIHAFRLVSIQPSPAKCCVHFSPQAGCPLSLWPTSKILPQGQTPRLPTQAIHALQPLQPEHPSTH